GSWKTRHTVHRDPAAGRKAQVPFYLGRNRRAVHPFLEQRPHMSGGNAEAPISTYPFSLPLGCFSHSSNKDNPADLLPDRQGAMAIYSRRRFGLPVAPLR